MSEKPAQGLVLAETNRALVEAYGDRRGAQMMTALEAMIRPPAPDALVAKIPGGGVLLAWMQFPHDTDYFLATVLVRQSPGRYATWLYNSQQQGMVEGHYFHAFVNATDVEVDAHQRGLAYQDFVERAQRPVRSFTR